VANGPNIFQMLLVYANNLCSILEVIRYTITRNYPHAYNNTQSIFNAYIIQYYACDDYDDDTMVSSISASQSTTNRHVSRINAIFPTTSASYGTP